MADPLKNPFVQKVVWTVVSTLLGLLTLKIAPAQSADLLAGLVMGGGTGAAWVRGPGRVNLPKPKKVQ